MKNAGVTTGAFYGYYKDKLSLFDGLVSDAANGLIDLYKKMSISYFESAKILSIDNLMDNSISMIYEFIDYIYLHFDEFKLIFNKSEGTEYAHYLDTLIEYDVKDTMRFIDILKNDNKFEKHLPENVVHVLVTAYYEAIIEIVHHEIPEDQSAIFITHITAFFNSGWRALFCN